MRMASIWTQAKKILCPRRPRGFQFMGFGRMMNPVGRTTTPVEKLLALAGLQYLGANTPYMFYPNDPSRSASNRHYFYVRGQGWADCLGTSFAAASGTRIEMYDTSGANALPLLLLYFDCALTAGEIATLTGTAFKTAIGATYSLAVGSVAAVSIDPPDYTNMVGWWDASWATTLGNNDPVTNWYDKGYLNSTLNQAGAASLKPTHKTNVINGRPTRYFDGGDRLDCNAVAAYFTGADKPFSCVAVVKRDNTSAYHVVSAISNTDGTTKLVATCVFANSQLIYCARTDNAGASKYPIRAHGTTTNAEVHSIVSPGTTVSSWYNNNLAVNAEDCDVGETTLNAFALGGRIESTAYLYGHIAELILWKTAITTAQRLAVQTYLAAKWGITLA